jgi:hypothetical protein
VQTYAVIRMVMHARVMRQYPARADETEAIDVGALEVFPVFHAASCFMCLFCVACSNFVWIASSKTDNWLSLLANNKSFIACR